MRISTALLAFAFIAGLAIVSAPPAAAQPDASRQAASAKAQPTDVSAAKRKSRRSYRARARARTGTQIACTRFGCRPIPPGCRIVTEYNFFTWNPSGFDAVVCPRR